MVEHSGFLKASFGSSETAKMFEIQLNALHDACWEPIRKQLPRKGVISTAGINTDTSEVVAAFLPAFQKVVPATSLQLEDVALLCGCTARHAGEGITLSMTFSGKSIESLRRVATILRSAGAHSIEALWANESGLHSEHW